MWSPVCERWHLASALTVSVPVHRGRSAAVLVDRFFFLHALPVPSRLSHVLSEVHARILRSLPKPETLTGPLATSCRCFAAGKRDQLRATCILRQCSTTVSAIAPADPGSTPERHATSASEDRPEGNSMPDDLAWLRSALCPGTGSIPNHAVRSIPSTPFPAGLSPDRQLRLERKHLPVSHSRLPPSPALLPFLRLCPSCICRIPCDLSPFLRRQLLQSGFDRP